ncbi:MAG: UvrB/UvrC motif-containing protein [Candidatus Vogelbacteria bacterium]|nr:UvrB/UvrC motif-containing protein [Candidatus Vogelbacteria bacterium]
MKQPRTKVDNPGVYLFKKEREILYIGKATSLRDRVRSYFNSNILKARGPRIVGLIKQATSIQTIPTDSVLEALILEANLIKKYQPKYNVQEKDDKSFLYVAITKEDFPRVLLERGRGTYGPFPHPGELREALKIIRKIFPFRDTCQLGQTRPCFNAQIGLCPGVCVGAIAKAEYARTIRHLKLFFSGKKSQLIKQLEREMNQFAKNQEFEKAAQARKQIFALQHIRDVALIKHPMSNTGHRMLGDFRIEAYDIAHTSGRHTVGVMIVVENGEAKKSDYRRFKLEGNNDIANLKSIINRRLNHVEWLTPNLIVVDGGVAQHNVVQTLLRASERKIPIVAVVKDERHRAKKLLGEPALIVKHRDEILFANREAHRFAVAYHRQSRGRMV